MLAESYYEALEPPQGKELVWFDDPAHVIYAEESEIFVLSSTSLSGPLASALHWQPGRYPCFLALAVLPHVCAAYGHQLTGGLQRSGSRRVPAVEYYLGLLVGEQVGRHRRGSR